MFSSSESAIANNNEITSLQTSNNREILATKITPGLAFADGALSLGAGGYSAGKSIYTLIQGVKLIQCGNAKDLQELVKKCGSTEEVFNKIHDFYGTKGFYLTSAILSSILVTMTLILIGLRASNPPHTNQRVHALFFVQALMMVLDYTFYMILNSKECLDSASCIPAGNEVFDFLKSVGGEETAFSAVKAVMGILLFVSGTYVLHTSSWSLRGNRSQPVNNATQVEEQSLLQDVASEDYGAASSDSSPPKNN